MDKKMLNTTYDFKLADGTTVKTTVSFFALLQLKSKNESLYRRYNKILQSTNKDNFDILDMVTIVYVGYVCANLKSENVMSEEEFFELCGSNISKIGAAVNALIRPKS